MTRAAGAPGIEIREYAPADAEAVVALWEACGLTRPWNDPRADLARAHAQQPELLLVATSAPPAADRRPIGTVMAGYDGHRGWLYYLAADPARRGEGIGRALVAEAERRLAALGCPKVQLMVRSENTGVLAYYDRLGYEPSDVSVLARRLDGS